jgi:CRP-like cAMP-binding protein
MDLVETRNPLTDRLEHFARLSADDRKLLEAVTAGPVLSVRPRRDIVREGERSRVANLILDGWAFRYKTLADGRRQIISFLLPGDICDPYVYILQEMDHSIGALTAVRYVELGRDKIEALTSQHPRLTHALRWDALVAAAIQREWTLNLGQRDAIERLAHLLCELFFRLRAVGHTDRNRCEMPLTQSDVAEATGMTPVHVNRMIQELRARGLIRWKGREVEVLDMEALCDVAMFNPNYLHLNREGAHLDANG